MIMGISVIRAHCYFAWSAGLAEYSARINEMASRAKTDEPTNLPKRPSSNASSNAYQTMVIIIQAKMTLGRSERLDIIRATD